VDSSGWADSLVWLGIGVTAVALVLLALAPAGWRLGLWHFRTSFFFLIPGSVLLALVGAMAGVSALFAGGKTFGPGEVTLAAISILVGIGLAAALGQFKRAADRVPRIHDITTDTANPPQFRAVLPARQVERANPTDYGGAEIAKKQTAAYPDIVPLVSSRTSGVAFAKALEAADDMPGWRIVAQDPAMGQIEATETSRWFGFADDIVIRIAAAGTGSRVDVRSTSRQGISDLGVNAARIRAFMARLGPQLR